MTNTHTHVSFSQMDLWQRCPRAWYYRKVVRLPEREGIEAAQSKAIHAVLADAYKGAIAGDGFPSCGALQALVTPTAWPDSDLLDHSLEELSDQTNAMVRTLYPFASTLRVAEVETPITFDLGPPTNWTVKCVPDLIDVANTIHDWKSKSANGYRYMNEKALRKDLQMRLYAVARQLREHQCILEPQRVQWNVVTREDVPKFKRVTVVYSVAEMEWTLRQVHQIAYQMWGVIKMMEPCFGDEVQHAYALFPPNNTHALCTSEWCDYWGTCKPQG